MDDHIVITGLGAVTAIGSNAPRTWHAVLSGQCGISSMTGLEGAGPPPPPAARVPGLSARDLGIGRKDARFLGKAGLMLLKASQEAFGHAGLDERPLPADRIGFFAGMGAVDARPEDLGAALSGSLGPDGALSHARFFADGYRAIHPLWPLSILNNIAFCQTAIHLDIRGENAVFSPYNDAGVQAVIEGAETLRRGHARAVIAAGVSERVTPFSMARAANSGLPTAPAASRDAPWRPFGRSTPGTVPGEGAGALVLERHGDAEAGGATCLARMCGHGCVCEPEGESGPPTAAAVLGAMEAALTSAGLSFRDMDVLIAHGDGTGADRNEMEALTALLQQRRGGPALFFSKASLGNLLAGAPVVDAVLAVSMISESGFPPVLNPEPQNPGGLPMVCGGPVAPPVNRVMINSLGPGGQAVSFILESCEAGTS
jgi:3-oxoacyl-[acyl-carrier-protein] synthase II